MDRQRSSNQGGSNSAAKPHQQQLNSAHRQQHANKPAATNSGSGGHKRKPPPPQQQQQQQQHSKKMRNSDRQAQHLQQQQQWQAKKQHNNQTQQQKQQQPQQPPTKKQMKKQQKQQQAQQQEIPTSPGQQLKRLQQYHQFLNSMQRHQQQLQRQGHVAEPLQASPADTSAAETALQMLVQSQVLRPRDNSNTDKERVVLPAAAVRSLVGLFCPGFAGLQALNPAANSYPIILPVAQQLPPGLLALPDCMHSDAALLSVPGLLHGLHGTASLMRAVILATPATARDLRTSSNSSNSGAGTSAAAAAAAGLAHWFWAARQQLLETLQQPKPVGLSKKCSFADSVRSAVMFMAQATQQLVQAHNMLLRGGLRPQDISTLQQWLQRQQARLERQLQHVELRQQPFTAQDLSAASKATEAAVDIAAANAVGDDGMQTTAAAAGPTPSNSAAAPAAAQICVMPAGILRPLVRLHCPGFADLASMNLAALAQLQPLPLQPQLTPGLKAMQLSCTTWVFSDAALLTRPGLEARCTAEEGVADLLQPAFSALELSAAPTAGGGNSSSLSHPLQQGLLTWFKSARSLLLVHLQRGVVVSELPVAAADVEAAVLSCVKCARLLCQVYNLLLRAELPVHEGQALGM